MLRFTDAPNRESIPAYIVFGRPDMKRGKVTSKGLGPVRHDSEFKIWANSQGLTVNQDRGLFVNHELRIFAQSRSEVSFSQLESGKSYFLFIDLVRYGKRKTRFSIFPQMRIRVNGKVAQKLSVPTSGSYNAGRHVAVVAVVDPGEEIRVQFEVLSGESQYWGIRDIFLSTAPEIPSKVFTGFNSKQLRDTDRSPRSRPRANENK